MTNITAALVKELREKTGVGMLACKKALTESTGNVEQAIEILRKRGEAKASEKNSRSTNEGIIAIKNKVIIKLLCETDFVAKNEKFIAFGQALADKANQDGEKAAYDFFESQKSDQIQAIGENINLVDVKIIEGGDMVSGYVHSNKKLGCIVSLDGGTEEQAKDVAMHAVAMNPEVCNPEDVSSELIEKEKEIYQEQLKKEGKPEQIMEKIIDGKIKKFCAERALTSQPFVKDPSVTVAKYLGNAKLINFIRMSI